MSYINESLADNERLIYRARFHWLSKIGAWTMLAIFLGVALACLAFASGLSAWIAVAIMVGLGITVFAAMMMPIWTTEIGVTSQRLIYKRGWLRRATPVLADPVGLRRALQEAMGASKVVVAVPEAPPLSQSAA